MSSRQIIVQTAIEREPLAEGMIYTHEHLWLNLSTARDPAGKLDQFELIVEEIRTLKALGVAAIMELSCLGMGRSIEHLQRIQLATGVQIIPATGYYHQGFHPQSLRTASVEQIAESLARELTNGCEGTSVRPMLLGEIGGSGDPLHKDEVKVFKAVASLARQFPVVVTTHAHLGGGAQKELDLLLAGGIAPERILIGHLDLCPSLEEVLRIAQQGAYVGFDTVGKQSYAPDQRRIEYIKAFIEAGLAERILLSCDISRNAYLRANGGQGYAHLIQTFLPMLTEQGIAPATIKLLTEENPRRFLAAAALPLANPGGMS
ncbi:phosphotriesterase family protein [Ktedonosporobacter rubrisoli]|uniref:phosphotriesterase family protein n=1 Tax=Ktedonosporobacter rubrisoli TaxID=2509675 RepID=UPI0013EE5540|nr:phosphotriesterase-related protein [Ktedonosporobacter rubrisoli]